MKEAPPQCFFTCSPHTQRYTTRAIRHPHQQLISFQVKYCMHPLTYRSVTSINYLLTFVIFFFHTSDSFSVARCCSFTVITWLVKFSFSIFPFLWTLCYKIQSGMLFVNNVDFILWYFRRAEKLQMHPCQKHSIHLSWLFISENQMIVIWVYIIVTTFLAVQSFFTFTFYFTFYYSVKYPGSITVL